MGGEAPQWWPVMSLQPVTICLGLPVALAIGHVGLSALLEAASGLSKLSRVILNLGHGSYTSGSGCFVVIPYCLMMTCSS